MRSSAIVASLFAALAVASPIHQAFHKRALVWDIVTEIVTVTVTAGQEPPSVVKVQKTVFVNPLAQKASQTSSIQRVAAVSTTTSSSPPPPPPTTSSTPPPPPPPPSTTAAPTTTVALQAAAVFVSTSASTTAPAPTQAPPPPASPSPEQPAASPSPAPASPPSSSSGNQIQDAALNGHNARRAQHGVGPVTWDDDLANSAAQLASSCTNQHDVTIGGGGYGQNIAAQASSTPNSMEDTLATVMADAATDWYNEGNQFGSLYGQADVTDDSVLHFTQMVWKGTGSIGCAVAYCGTQGNIFPPSNGFTFYAYTVVCNYKAPGNFAGEYAQNVLPPS